MSTITSLRLAEIEITPKSYGQYSVHLVAHDENGDVHHTSFHSTNSNMWDDVYDKDRYEQVKIAEGYPEVRRALDNKIVEINSLFLMD
jgi:hypothetical protein